MHKTLNNKMALVKKVPLKPGLNASVLNNLKDNTAELQPHEMLCILTFDEMAIDPHLAFNGKEFEGFEDLGDTSTSTIADHAQVFMLRRINGKWKQPIAYTFSKSSTKTIDLVRILKAIIKECTEIGFSK
jgi:hypothetical protein